MGKFFRTKGTMSQSDKVWFITLYIVFSVGITITILTIYTKICDYSENKRKEIKVEQQNLRDFRWQIVQYLKSEMKEVQ